MEKKQQNYLNQIQKKKIKILFAINCMNIGGAPSVVFDQMKHLNADFFEIHLLMLYKSKPSNFLSQIDFIPTSHIVQKELKNRSVFDFRTHLGIYKYLRMHDFNIVYTHLFLTNFIVRTIAVLARSKHIVSFEHSLYFNKTKWQIVADRILAKFTKIIVVSTKEVAEFTVSQQKLPPKKCVVVRNPVSVPLRQEVNFERLSKIIPLHKTANVFVTIGRFSDEKGQDVLVKAAILAYQQNKNLQFLIVGHGPFQQKISDLIAYNDAEAYIHLIKDPLHAKEYLYLADYFILPSKREGQAMVAEEAMLVGVPVLASRLKGMGKLIIEGYNGALVPSGDIKALSKVILLHAGNDELHHTYTTNLRSFQNNFTAKQDRVLALEKLFIGMVEHTKKN